MKHECISDFSDNLAKEISGRNIFDLQEISLLIRMRTHNVLHSLMDEYSTKAEIDYRRLLEQQSKNRPGSQDYIIMGYRLSQAKQKKASANRAANNIRKEDEFELLKQFIIGKFGIAFLNEFFEAINID